MFPQSSRNRSIQLCNPKSEHDPSNSHSFLPHRSCSLRTQRQCSRDQFETVTTCGASRDIKPQSQIRHVSTTDPRAPPPSLKTDENGAQTPLKPSKDFAISSPQIFQKALDNPIIQPDLSVGIPANEDLFINHGKTKEAGLASRYRRVKKLCGRSPQPVSPAASYIPEQTPLQLEAMGNIVFAKHTPSLGSRTLNEVSRRQQDPPPPPPSSSETRTPATTTILTAMTQTHLSHKPLPPLPRKPRSGTASSNSSVTLRVFPPSPTSTLASSSHGKSLDQSFDVDKDLSSSPVAGSFLPLMLDAKEPISFFDEDDDDKMGLVEYVKCKLRLDSSSRTWKKQSSRRRRRSWRKWLCCCSSNDVE